MFNFTSKIEKFCDNVLIPAAQKTDAGIAYGVPAATEYTANKINAVSTWAATKAKESAEKNAKLKAEGQAIYDKAFPKKVEVTKAPAAITPMDGEMLAMIAAAYMEMSGAEKMAFCMQQPEAARLIKDFMLKMNAKKGKK